MGRGADRIGKPDRKRRRGRENIAGAGESRPVYDPFMIKFVDAALGICAAAINVAQIENKVAAATRNISCNCCFIF